MSNAPKRWLIADPAPPAHLLRYRGMSPVLAQVLYNRGFEDAEAAFQFLLGDPAPFDPFKLEGMNKAVARVRQAIKQQQLIVVYGDFDADGVTATALLTQALRALGAVVMPYIPHRIDEGYGLNTEALLTLRHRHNARLIITVDCGIRSVKEVADGKKAGLDIIVTDHHSVGDEIPHADAVINPKQAGCKYPEKMLAGVGIAYKLADALFRVAAQNPREHQPNIPLDSLLDLVAIGTVADLAPLDRLENRLLVRRGLEVINERGRLGVRALLDVAAPKEERVDSERIGFSLGPRINAAGRLGSAMTAYDLLTSEQPVQAARLAEQLHLLNTRRQELTREAQEKIRQRLDATAADAPLIFAQDASFQEGIVGLVAGRLVEEFYRPAVVLHTGDTESRASCRSIPQFDITRALDQCADLLIRHGGHAQAAGLTVHNANVPRLHERLLAIAEQQLAGQELAPLLDIDMELPPTQLDLPLAEELRQLEPTGHQNRPPLFASRGMEVKECRTVGKEDQHLKLRLSRPGLPPLDAIGFHLGSLARSLPTVVDVAFTLEINEWNGSRSAQLNLQDVRPGGA